VLITIGIPRSNGQVERVNRTLSPLLSKLADPARGEWYKHLGLTQQCLNTTLHRSLGTSPFNVFKDNIWKIQEENRRGFNRKRKETATSRENDLVAIKRTQEGPVLKLTRSLRDY